MHDEESGGLHREGGDRAGPHQLSRKKLVRKEMQKLLRVQRAACAKGHVADNPRSEDGEASESKRP